MRRPKEEDEDGVGYMASLLAPMPGTDAHGHNEPPGGAPTRRGGRWTRQRGRGNDDRASSQARIRTREEGAKGDRGGMGKADLGFRMDTHIGPRGHVVSIHGHDVVDVCHDLCLVQGKGMTPIGLGQCIVAVGPK